MARGFYPRHPTPSATAPCVPDRGPRGGPTSGGTPKRRRNRPSGRPVVRVADQPSPERRIDAAPTPVSRPLVRLADQTCDERVARHPASSSGDVWTVRRTGATPCSHLRSTGPTAAAARGARRHARDRRAGGEPRSSPSLGSRPRWPAGARTARGRGATIARAAPRTRPRRRAAAGRGRRGPRSRRSRSRRHRARAATRFPPTLPPRRRARGRRGTASPTGRGSSARRRRPAAPRDALRRGDDEEGIGRTAPRRAAR